MLFENVQEALEEEAVRELGLSDIKAAASLIAEVFLRHDARECTKEGVEWFLEFVDETHLRDEVREGLVRFYGLEEGGELVAVGAIRGEQHLALLFVATEAQGKGYGHRLLEELVRRIFLEEGIHQATVNAALMAVKFYDLHGFLAVGEKEMHCGIPYVPMIRKKTPDIL